MDCNVVKSEIVAYLQGEVADDVRAQIEEHLAGCASCREWCEETRASLAQVEKAEEDPTVHLSANILQQAIRDGASDVHLDLEKWDDGSCSAVVRQRIDGVLHEVMRLPGYAHAPLVSRFKIMADLDVAEKRLPQNGRMALEVEGKPYDLRLSTFPGAFAERVAIRFIDHSVIGFELPQMGLGEKDEADLRALLARPTGLLLFAGPMGCGKTTVMFSALKVLNTLSQSVCTVEDPVLYQLPGVNHSSVNREIGLTYPVALRRLIELDPDVILVGELDNPDTARAAIDAAQTGHFLLSKMFAFDALGGLQRLLDFGLPPFLVATTLVGVCSLRLIRRICAECKEEYHPPESGLELLSLSPDEATYYHGAGCENCRQTGYKGRRGIFEVLTVGEAVQSAIQDGADADTLRRIALESGFRPLIEDGRRKVREGITTVEEVVRVTR
jgi:type II secretory ATPase GspE/PulE/Tfp pilus assembly ATPase PilB-like protein